MDLLEIVELQKKKNAGIAARKNGILSDITVMKFGGCSVGSAEKILHAADVIGNVTKESRGVVVVSAMRGVTDKLITLFLQAKSGELEVALSLLQELSFHHFQALDELQLPKELFESTGKVLVELFEQLRLYLLSKERFTQADYDFVVAFGERFSSQMLASALQKKGLSGQAVDSATVIVVTNKFGNAKALLTQTKKRANKILLPLLKDHIIPVVSGFYGETLSGKVAILGRGGSDYSATVLAHTLEANEVILWKEVDGVFSGDPHREKNVEFFPELSYEKALKLAQNGAKILHPEAMKPVAFKEIPVLVKNTLNLSHSGTKIWKGSL